VVCASGKLQLTTPENNLATYTFNQRVIKHHYILAVAGAPFGFVSAHRELQRPQ
jgi:hypothetical protein